MDLIIKWRNFLMKAYEDDFEDEDESEEDTDDDLDSDE